MEPESQIPQQSTAPSTLPEEAERSPESSGPAGFDSYSPEWLIFGPQGLRAGASVLLAYVLYRFLRTLVGTAFFMAHLRTQSDDFSPARFLIGEMIPFLAMLATLAIIARIEHRRFSDYNLTGPRRPRHFLAGLAAGFIALSVLVGALAMGGWLHFGPVALSGAAIFRFAFVWGCVFLLVGCVEEGIFRCYLQFTLTRGINFWWALGTVAAMCLDLMWSVKGIGVWGVYIAALLGFVPCLYLHQKSVPRSAFWQAAWVTSTGFGFFHTSNNGENWIGIFAAAAIGFIFCVSIRVTGSAWWAIGCHAAWDWAETYFYGTANSGISAQGHYLTSTPAGNVLWSGGADGPEGSVLILAVLAMLLAALLLIHKRKTGRRKAALAPGVTAAADVSA